MSLIPPKHASETNSFHTWMGDDGICRTVTKPGTRVEIEDARQNTGIVTGFFNGAKFPLLVDSRNVGSVSYQARRHLSTNGRDTKINSMAILVDSPVSRVIGNFFMGLNKPAIPARLFDNEDDAVKWLKQFI